ncbi:MAG: cytochrome c peroxidase [Rudaea sp.]|nr:cytochrome c peroxidase [Rudaea sp.]
MSVIGALAIIVACLLDTSKPTTAADAGGQEALGKSLFEDKSLSLDGKVSCQSCHDPAHAYASAHARSIGVDGKTGTRNAPSLVGIANDDAFFWDGRRTRLEDVVLDPFTNPVELGLPSLDTLLERLGREPKLLAEFRETYPKANSVPTIEQVQTALASFVSSLTTTSSQFELLQPNGHLSSAVAEQGRLLFEGIAGCSDCHRVDGRVARFTDGQYHHSGVEQSAISARLSAVTQAVVTQNLDAAGLGPKLLIDPEWSALGRFCVTHNPADIGAFRTPSLRNVAITAPYMHDGSIATLADAVDHEIYYRGFSNGHPINLSLSERQALVAFLETLTDGSVEQTNVP